MMKSYKAINAWSAVIILSLVIIDILTWRSIFSRNAFEYPRMYFFNVAQGSSALLMLSENIKIMIDSGGDEAIVQKLDPLFADIGGSYINIAIISYPQTNNYEGYYYILDHYTIGAFLYDGRNDVVNSHDWARFLDVLTAKKIPLITLAKSDRIRYENNVIDILSPDASFGRSADITDAALVENIKTPQFTALLASDIGTNVGHMLATASSSIRADILKVPYPAMSGADGIDLMKKIAPRAAIIQPGTKNTASYPSRAMIAQLSLSTNTAIFNTMQNGTIIIYENAEKLRILKGK